MSVTGDVAAIKRFLLCATPESWVRCAVQNQHILLVDHANCEKKAASTAMNLLYRYVDHHTLMDKLSRLAREELRHFEQGIGIMKARGMDYPQLTASRYAGSLRLQVRKSEPDRLVDTLLIGAIIEARSCERFAALMPALDDELASFYRSLLKSEARHFTDYLTLAASVTCEQAVAERLPLLLACERDLIERPDAQFRFHSGPPHSADGPLQATKDSQ